MRPRIIAFAPLWYLAYYHGVLSISSVEMHKYKRVRVDGATWTASGPAAVPGARSAIGCAGVCAKASTCNAFSFDASVKQCQVGASQVENPAGDTLVYMDESSSSAVATDCGVPATVVHVSDNSVNEGDVATYDLNPMCQSLAWFPQAGATSDAAEVVLDLGCQRRVDGVLIKNGGAGTNAPDQSTSTFQLSVCGGDDVSCPTGWSPDEEFADVADMRTKLCGEIADQTFDLAAPQVGRFVRFRVKAFYGVGGGLQYLKALP